MQIYPYRIPTLWSLLILILASVSFLQAGEVEAPEKLRYNSDTWHPAVDYLKFEKTRATDEQLEALEKLPLETVWGVIRGMGYTNTFYNGMQMTLPGKRLVGVVLGVILLSALAFYQLIINWPQANPYAMVKVNIPKGANVTDVSRILKEMNIGDSNYITPYWPHSFTNRNPNQPVIIAKLILGIGQLTNNQFHQYDQQYSHHLNLNFEQNL